MALYRTGKQEYPDAAALLNETMLPKENDTVYLEQEGRDLNWVQGSTATPNGKNVFEQTVATGGRWIAMNTVTTYTGSITTSDIPNAVAENLTITVNGVVAGAQNELIITNFAGFPAGISIETKEVSGKDQVALVVKNNTGSTIPAFPVNVTVIEF